MIILASFVFDWMYVIYPVILFMLFIGVRFFLVHARRKTDHELQRLLFIEGNLFLYDELLKNKRLNLFFTQAEKDLLRLNGYMALGTQQQIKHQLDVLNQKTLKPKLALELYHKEMTYYIEITSYKQALESYEKLQSLLKNKKSEAAKKIMIEAKWIIDIYVHHDLSRMDELIELEKQTEHQLLKGVILYRLAKLSYFAKKPKDVMMYLEKAEPLLKRTTYEPIIKKAYQDQHILKTK
jgi:tetratricopeptide (TPR) repeat protein